MSSNRPPSSAVVTAALDQAQAPRDGQTLFDLVAAERPRVAALVGRVLDPDRLLAAMGWALRTTPGLAACTPQSLISALHFCAQVGLLPGPQQHVHLVPYWNTQRRVREVQPIIGYRGFWHLGRRAGYLQRGVAQIIWPQDQYRITLGVAPTLEHLPAYGRREGDPLLVYSVIWLPDGATSFEVMEWPEVLSIRARVLKRKRSAEPGPWETDLFEMARKTAVRRHAKQWDLTPEVAWAIAADEARELGDEAEQTRLNALAPVLWAAADANETAEASPAAEGAPPPSAPPDAAAPDARTGDAPAGDAVPAPSPSAKRVAKTAEPTAEEIAFTKAWTAARDVVEEADLIAAIRGVVGDKKRPAWTPEDWAAATAALQALAATGAPF